MRRRQDRRGGTVDGCAVCVQYLAFTRELGGSAVGKIPVLGVSGDKRQSPLLALAPDEDGWVRLLQAFRFAVGVGDAVVLSGKTGPRLRQQAGDDVAGFLETVESLCQRTQLDAVRLGFFFVPPRPESELEAATGDDVGRGRHIGQDGGMSVVDTGDEGSES
ncbi:Uncharacterised protein [Mycobacteroides abscessus subsp. abscessus]|nr:Uncharacterised protein [Mycobacteroides abscessus subsp. abscessus]